jgi:hypothetical protein
VALILFFCFLAAGIIMQFVTSHMEGQKGRGTPTSTVPTADAPPAVGIDVHCDIAGGGYRVTPKWPGDIEGLAGYRVRLETGLVGELGLWTDKYSPYQLKRLYKLPPGIPIELSVVAEMKDGRRSPEGRGRIVLPASAC